MLTYFYHGIIRKVIVAFGTLFDDIYVSRRNSQSEELERIKIPLAYGPKQKFVIRADSSNPDLSRQFSMDLPRMGYEFVDIQYDVARKLNTVQKSVFPVQSTNTSMYERMERVPYNLFITLHIVSKNTDDALQILEQILPYFGPDFNVTLSEITPDSKIDVPISILKIEKSEDYEEDFSQLKSFTLSIQFVAKVHLYGPSTTSRIITQSEVNFYDQYDMDSLVLGATGATALSLIFSVTGGATAGSIGATGTIYERRIDYGEL